MADDKKNAYGTPGDTGFRRTWDREEWAAKAKEREAKVREEGKARAEAKAAGKKYYRETTPEDAVMVAARRERINFDENLNKTTLVPAGAGVGKRGKSAGFYCEHCDLTFKDSLQWVDHLNSKQHLYATGKTDEVERATLEQVRQRLDWLRKKKKEQESGGEYDLKKNLEERAKKEEEERIRKREKRKASRAAKRLKAIKQEEADERDTAMTGITSAGEEDEDADAAAMARMMGFSGGFGSTKRN